MIPSVPQALKPHLHAAAQRGLFERQEARRAAAAPLGVLCARAAQVQGCNALQYLHTWWQRCPVMKVSTPEESTHTPHIAAHIADYTCAGLRMQAGVPQNAPG